MTKPGLDEVMANAEINYAKMKAVQWSHHLLQRDLPISSELLECLEWSMGSFKDWWPEVRSFLEKTCHEEKDENVLEAARGILRHANRLTLEMQDIKHNNKDFHDQLEKIVRSACLRETEELLQKSSKTIPANFVRTKKLLQKFFSLSEDA